MSNIQNRQDQTPDRQAQHPVDSMRNMLKQNKGYFSQIMGVDIRTVAGVADVGRVCATAWGVYKDGGEGHWRADDASFISGVATIVGLGLSLNPSRQEAFLIPRDRTVGKDGAGNWIKVREFNVQYGWRGLIKLATRDGRITRLKPVVVYEGDHFVHHEGTAPRIEHVPQRGIDDDRGKIIAAYACAWERGSDDPIFVVCYRDVLEAAAAKSGDGRGGISKVWSEHFAAMACKTAVRRLCKLLPDITDDLQLALREAPADKPEITITQAVAEFEQPDGPTAMPPRQVPAHDGLDALVEADRQ